MPRFRRTITLSLLLVLLALPAFAVPSTRANQNRGRGILSTIWSSLVSLFSGETTDGRCGADPWGICTGGDSTNQRGTVDPVG